MTIFIPGVGVQIQITTQRIVMISGEEATGINQIILPQN